jgi:hypothetical protein
VRVLLPIRRPWATHSGGCAPSAITLSSSRVPSTLAGNVAATVPSGAGGASPVPSDPDGPVTVSGGRVWAGGASPPSTTPRTFHRTITPSTAAPTMSQLRSAGFDPPPERAGAPCEGRFEGVGRRTGA